MLVYVVEDDENIREIESYSLTKNGFEVREFSDGENLLNECLDLRPNLIILDIMLPGKDGLSLLKELRENKDLSTIPIMLISAKSSEIDKVKGLDMGADDYLTKPFGTMELVSRVNALLRRFKNDEKSDCSYREISIDDAKRSVTAFGKSIDLTFKEYELLKYFIANSQKALSRDKLLEAVWGYDFAGESRTVDMHIKTLRQKLGDAGTYIKTVRNVGYILE
ncbi:MAG: response regulator transcription factor [Lachnospiraceae bacterium]|nr:response regulator transcription factor [Lachnospiraceae bacterium]